MAVCSAINVMVNIVVKVEHEAVDLVLHHHSGATDHRIEHACRGWAESDLEHLAHQDKVT